MPVIRLAGSVRDIALWLEHYEARIYSGETLIAKVCLGHIPADFRPDGAHLVLLTDRLAWNRVDLCRRPESIGIPLTPDSNGEAKLYPLLILPRRSPLGLQ